MEYLIGQETCRSCGATQLLVMTCERVRTDPDTCESCGVRACVLPVLFTLHWPELEALVHFDEERSRLKLPPLSDAPWQ